MTVARLVFRRLHRIPLTIALCILLLISGVGENGASAAETAVDVRDHDAAGDGETDDTQAFAEAIEAIGEADATLTVVDGVYRVDGLHVPENIALAFHGGGRLEVPEGGRIEIDGAIEAALVTIFSGDGAVVGHARTHYVYPQWFGAAGDGERDDTQALQRAADLAAESVGRTLFIPAGDYRFLDTLTFRCNIECRGRLIQEIRIDESRTRFSYNTYLPTHYPERSSRIVFAPDHAEIELDMQAFYGIEEGDFTLPIHRDVPLADGSGHVDLAEGGTLRVYSSDYFTSRAVRKGSRWYDRNDMTQLVSSRGDIFPEFAFSYAEPPDAEPWSDERHYQKGDYCTYEGELFKATWESGEQVTYEHRHLGEAEIGAVQPRPDAASTRKDLVYEDGTEDNIFIWRRVRTQIWYRPKDTPLTVNGMQVRVRLEDHGGETKRISGGSVSVHRSNITFNDLHVSVRDREAMMSQLVRSRGCVNVEFNRGYFSGATAEALGYNLLNSNVANFRYNDCISTNSRKGLDGRHGKNVTIQGGYYNVIDDHYGRNYVIRDVTLSGQSVRVPGLSTPDADLDAWHFRTIRPFAYAGKNLRIEDCRVLDSSWGLLVARGDVADLYGRIVLRNIVIGGDERDVAVLRHRPRADFDYVHEVRTPDEVIIENVRTQHGGRLHVQISDEFADRYGPIEVTRSGPIGRVQVQGAATFTDVTFRDSDFDAAAGPGIDFIHCVFAGVNSGLDASQIRRAIGNVREHDAEVDFPLEHFNEELFDTAPGDR